MTSPFRILEILTCSLVSFLPFVMLLTYPFRNNLRAVGFLTSLAAVLQLICDLAIGMGIIKDPAAVKLIVLGIHMVLGLVLLRAPFGKKLFALLTTANSAVALPLAAGYLQGLLFPDHAAQPYHFTYLLILIALEALILLPFALLLMRRHVQVSGGHVAAWGTLWLIPAAVFVIWIYMSLFGLLNLPVDLVMIGLTLFACLITLPFIRKPMGQNAEEKELPLQPAAAAETDVPAEKVTASLEEQLADLAIPETRSAAPAIPAPEAPAEEKNVPQDNFIEIPAPKPRETKTETPSLSDQKTKKLPFLRTSKEPDFSQQMQAQQYDHLQTRIFQSNQFHRELRRHIDAMAYRLERKQYDKLQNHLTSLQQQLAGEDEASFCENTALNSVLSYFTQMAGYCGVKVTTDVHLPDSAPVAAEDLTVLFGNLLDNALDACKKQPGSDRRIFASAWTDSKAMYLTVENTYDGILQKDRKGNYLSSKGSGCGMGLDVCKAIAERYSGKLEISDSNGIFKVNVTLKL